MKKRILSVAGLFAALLLLGASQGTQTDPLVTKSYIDQVLKPEILAQVDSKLAASQQSYLDQFKALVHQSGGSSESGAGGVFAVVTVKNGQTITLAAGSEFLLRTGSATVAAAAAPGLVDYTDGAALGAGEAVKNDHLYLSVSAGQSVKAAADLTVMVRGGYTVA